MKRSLFILTAIVCVSLFASCKKDYICTCRANGVVIGTETIHDSKKNARSECDENDVTIFGVVNECEID